MGINAASKPSGTGCVECLASDGWWLHLRRCAECGHIGCCDSSPSQHSSKHATLTGHPIGMSFEPGEDWFWNYEKQEMVEGAELLQPYSSHLPTNARTGKKSSPRLAITAELGRCVIKEKTMDTLQQGDRICLTFDNRPEQIEAATICQILTNQQEGMGPEVEDYVAYWIEISLGGCAEMQSRRTLTFGTDSQYSMDGRTVTTRKFRAEEKAYGSH